MGPLVALVGADGSGKSTLTSDIVAGLSATMAVRSCYLGLGSGDLGNRIRSLPLVGPAIERRLTKKAAHDASRPCDSIRAIVANVVRATLAAADH